MNSDTDNKRRKFIGKTHSLLQEFGFLDHAIVFDLMNIYATSFYGSNLWLFSSMSSERIFTSWNKMIRLVWNLPNTSHRYLIEEVSKKPHIKASLYQRYLVFLGSLRTSPKKCVASLVHRVCEDQGSITKKNINTIEADSKCLNVLSLNPRYVASNVTYAPVPETEIWRIGFLEDLISIRSNEQHLDGFSKKEIEQMIVLLATT